MTTTRGKCKMDLDRARVMAKHIQERVGWIPDEYREFEMFSLGVEAVLKAAVDIEDTLNLLLENRP